MSISLFGQHVLVTGSTDGLGKHLVFSLAKEGAVPIIHGRSQEKVKQTVDEIQSQYPEIDVQWVVCDLNKPEEISKQFSHIVSLDILINNAGVWLEGNTINANPEKIIEQIHVNLLAPLLITRTLIPLLLQSDFAQIINVSSVAGVEIPQDYYHVIYSAAKFGMQGFSEALAKEFFNKNLRVTGFYPGGMETNLFTKAGMDYKKHEPWMFNPQESVDAILFALKQDKKVSIKRMDLINQMDY